jgi:putative ABC transport system permease protein
MLVRSFIALRGTPPGFAADHVLAVGMRLPPAIAPGAPRAAFFEELRVRVESLPGVHSAGFVSSLPMGGGSDRLQFYLKDQPTAKPSSANFNIASPGYFRTMRIAVTAGREFTPADNASAPHAIVINQTAARQFWPGADPLGRQITMRGRPVVMTVVGVTGDVRQSDLSTVPRPEIFLSALQLTPDWPGFALVVHAASEPMSLVADVRASLRSVNPDVAIARIGAMEDVVAGRLAQPKVYTTLLGAFAVLALVLAAVGLYGVIGYSVAQRTRELGVRLALGSSPSSLVVAIMKHGAVLTAFGIALGLLGAYAATRSIATLLPGANASDPSTFVAAAAVMLFVGCTAAYIPARRAARVDPLIALRAE